MLARFSKHVLVADDDPDVLAAVRFSFGMAGIETYCADGINKAREILAHEIIHVAVIDVRLNDNHNVADTSGFDLVRELPPYIPCVIYTAYENIDTLRRALDDAKVKASIPKDEPDAAVRLQQVVEQLFAKEIKTNFALQIDSELPPGTIATKIELPDAERTAGWAPTIDDVTQILRTLFYDAQAIYVRSLLSAEQAPSVSQAGSLVALVTPKLAHGWGASKVVKFGARADIEQEAERYATFKDYPHDHRMPRLDLVAYARQIGGLTYSLIGGAESRHKLQVFADYYQDHEARDVIAVLDSFFRQTFATLYRDAQRVFLDLPHAYAASLNLTPDKLRQAISELRPAATTDLRLRFAGLTESHANPYLYAVRDGQFYSFYRLVPKCLCHGDLHGRNLLIDEDKHFWLIDFARVEDSHALRDFAELESDVKFGLLPETNLSTLLLFEQNLLSPHAFTQGAPRLAFQNKQLIKAQAVILALRKLAFELVQPDKDMQEYYQAVFMHTLKVLRLRHIPPGKKEHALLSAALLCERLDSWPQPPTWLEPPARPRRNWPTLSAGKRSDPASRLSSGKPGLTPLYPVSSKALQGQGAANQSEDANQQAAADAGSERSYEDFQLIVTAQRTIRASSTQGDVSGKFKLNLDAIAPLVEQIEWRHTDANLLSSLGSKLYQALFPNEIQGLWRATRAGAEAHESGVRLRLGLLAPELAALPWEFLYDTGNNTFLACDAQTVLSRYVDVAQIKRDLPAGRRPLRLLLIISSPTDLSLLDAAEEETLIRTALASHIAQGKVTVTSLDKATLRNVSQLIFNEPYDIVHFIGHGDFQHNKGIIALVNDDGSARWLDDRAFANLFLGNRRAGLVLLNSCRGAASSSSRAMTGVAPHLVQRGLPAVVAMQHTVLESTCVQFADMFYGALAAGQPLDTATQITRNAILLETGLDQPDFAAPVLFMRAKNGALL